MPARARGRRSRGILDAGPILAVVGLGVATLSLDEASSRLAVPLLGGLGIVLTAVIARLHRDPVDRRFLLNAMLLAVGVRFLLFALIHQTVGPYVFAPDQGSYEQMGQGILNAWRGIAPMPSKVENGFQVGYPYMNAIAFLIFGPALAALPAINVFLGSWLGVPAYHLALVAVPGDRGVARWAANLAMFFPSLMLWSVLNVREAPMILLITLSVYFFTKFQRDGGIWEVIAGVISVLLIVLFRQYLFALVGGAAVIGMFTGKSRFPGRSLLLGGIVLAVLAFVGRYTQVGGALADEPTLSQIEYLRQDLAFGAGSAYGAQYDVSTPAGALAFIPIGAAYFLLAPFPWAIRSGLQAVTVPETLLWYLLIPLGIRGAIRALRFDPRRFTVPAAVLATVGFAYMLVEGNVGTAYRHRAQILPLVFLFCAIGIQDWLVVRRQRRERDVIRREAAARRIQVAGPKSRS